MISSTPSLLRPRCASMIFAVVALVWLGSGAVAERGAQPAATQPAQATYAPDRAGESAEPLAARGRLASGLIGSKHDFRQINESVRDLCLPCHTPHLASAAPPRLDLRPTTTPPLRAYQGPGVELTGWSLLCLGCHDGVTAQDVYSSGHATAVAGRFGNSRLANSNVRSHPVGIRYPLAAEGYHPRAAVEAAGMLLPDGRIQCTTCHDAHNTERHDGMLRISNDRSRLCLSCHDL